MTNVRNNTTAAANNDLMQVNEDSIMSLMSIEMSQNLPPYQQKVQED